jgi:hypothetical protein
MACRIAMTPGWRDGVDRRRKLIAVMEYVNTFELYLLLIYTAPIVSDNDRTRDRDSLRTQKICLNSPEQQIIRDPFMLPLRAVIVLVLALAPTLSRATEAV